MTQFISTALVNTLATTIANTFNNGFLEIYSGSPGLTPEDVSGGTLLLSMPLPINAFDAALLGTIVMAGQWFGTVITSGTAAWARMCDPTNQIHIVLTVSNTSGNIVISDTALTIGGVVQIMSFTYTVPTTESSAALAALIRIAGAAGTGLAGIASAHSSGDAISISGLAASGAAGTTTISFSSNVSITGLEGTTSVATITGTSAILTGLESTGSAGTTAVIFDSTVSVAGATSTGAAGTPIAMYAVAVSITGSEGSGAADVTTASLSQVSLGMAGIGSAGTPTTMYDASASLVGSAGTGSVGLIAAIYDASASVSGAAGTGAAGTIALPLAWFSTRRVISNYAGHAMTVRRSSDNTTQDIDFTVGGALDIAALNTFVGSSVATVVKWYDQSNYGNHVTPSGVEPTLYIGNGKAMIAFYQNTLETTGPLAADNDQTIGIVFWEVDVGDGFTPLSDFDGTNGWLINTNSIAGRAVYYGNTTGFTSSTTGSIVTQEPSRLMITRAAGAVQTYVNGTADITGTTSNAASTAPLTIGGYNGSTHSFLGLVGEVFIYSSAINATEIAAIDSAQSAYWSNLNLASPYTGGSQLLPCGGSSRNITLGVGVLCYEYTQPWTAFAAFMMPLRQSTGNIQGIFTNAPSSGTAFPCYELWVDGSGHLRVRLIHDFGASQYLDVQGTTNVVDGNKHFVAASYDGSGTAAGVKLYVDGVPETTSIVLDALGGLSIVSAGNQAIWIGNQNPGSIPLVGTIAYFQLDNVVRSAAYIASCSPPPTVPPIDANTALCLPFTEGSGTTAHDTSGNGNNATISDATMWVP